MPGPAYATFGAVAYITGGQMTFSRGVQPSRCLLRKVAVDGITFSTATLNLVYDANVITLPNCAVVEVRNRHKYGREGWLQDVVVVDRRWMWKYARISGVYNERATDGTLQTENKKNLKELIELCLVALGESGYTTTAVPTDVYPPVLWNAARADLELQWLCDLAGLVVCYQVVNNGIAINKLNDTAGATMPDLWWTTPVQRYKPSVIPQNLRITGDPTVIQSVLTLEAVGLDTDNQIKKLDDLSYKPAQGWNSTWYDHFAEVDIDTRDLAFKTVWRWYRPSGNWDGDGVQIDDYTQLELLDHLVETEQDPDDIYRPLPPVVTGVYWPLCDHPINTSASGIHAGHFRILKDIGVIEFEYPVIKWTDHKPDEADLNLYVAYRVRKPDFDGWSVYTKDKAVSASTSATQYLTMRHPELTKYKIVDAFQGDVGDNLTDIDAEAESYLTRLEGTYDYTGADERKYNGLLAFATDGAIAQVQWEFGRGQLAFTRIGRYTEFDVYTAQQAQRKAVERLARMSDLQAPS
jgi:hypothetical protein